ncbi:MAG: hypothetical protein Q8S57_08545 [Methanoregula sp.]|nr:hypothetical protein [Methanoregula sp.]
MQAEVRNPLVVVLIELYPEMPDLLKIVFICSDVIYPDHGGTFTKNYCEVMAL